FDVTYSWGVLHHTGAMRQAIARSAALVKPGGLLALALYRRTPLCGVWRAIKKWYSSANGRSQAKARAIYVAVLSAALRTRGESLQDYILQYNGRGMDFYHDIHDWLGGYPYESIEAQTLRAWMLEHGFVELRSFTKPVRAFGLFGSGCDEYVFARQPRAGMRS